MHSSITIDQTEIPYTLRFSPRAKRLSVRMHIDLVEVVAPRSASEHMVHRFLRQHETWLYNNWQKLNHRKKKADLCPPPDFTDGSLLLYNGENHRLTLTTSANAVVPELMFKDGFQAYLPPKLKNPAEKLAQHYRAWLRLTLQSELTQLINHYSKQLRLIPNGFRIKITTSRWGSCSIKKNLNFSLYLMLIPEAVRAYVVVHELCHLKHMNHSPAFWQLVASVMPEYKTHRKWLKEIGSGLLHSYPL